MYNSCCVQYPPYSITTACTCEHCRRFESFGEEGLRGAPAPASLLFLLPPSPGSKSAREQ